MELLYALMIFFGVITVEEPGCNYDACSYQALIDGNQQIIQAIENNDNLLERIRTIDRTED